MADFWLASLHMQMRIHALKSVCNLGETRNCLRLSAEETGRKRLAVLETESGLKGARAGHREQ